MCISDKIILRGAPNFLCEVLHTRPKTESYKNLAIFSRPPDPSCCGAGYRKEQRGFDDAVGSLSEQQNWEIVMEINTWATPVACEVCVGMEVTSYMSAEI